MQDFREKLVDFHNSGVRHNRAGRELVMKMEHLGQVLDEERGMEEVAAPFAQVGWCVGSVRVQRPLGVVLWCVVSTLSADVCEG